MRKTRILDYFLNYATLTSWNYYARLNRYCKYRQEHQLANFDVNFDWTVVY